MSRPWLLKERPNIRKLIAQHGWRLVPDESSMIEDREGRRMAASEGILKQLRKQAHEGALERDAAHGFSLRTEVACETVQ